MNMPCKFIRTDAKKQGPIAKPRHKPIISFVMIMYKKTILGTRNNVKFSFLYKKF